MAFMPRVQTALRGALAERGTACSMGPVSPAGGLPLTVPRGSWRVREGGHWPPCPCVPQVSLGTHVWLSGEMAAQFSLSAFLPRAQTSSRLAPNGLG